MAADRLNRILGHLSESSPTPVYQSLLPQPTSSSSLIPRNPGMPLDNAWVANTRINLSAIHARADSLDGRRTVKKDSQLAWLLRCITLMDLTTLSGDDTPSNVERLCKKAAHPLRPDFVQKLKLDKPVTVAAICVYPNRVEDAVKYLKGTGIPVASVAAGFPAGQTPLKERLGEIRAAVAAGATEIDIVIPRTHAITGRWDLVYDEVKQMREACGEAHLKTILAVGDLPTYTHVYKASLVSMMAGSDFIKTSTGKEATNATLPVGLVMVRAIREYHERTGFKVGFKPAGGISAAKTAITWLSMMFEELGEEWTRPNLFRLGASSLLLDIERQIEHGLSGVYANKNYMPMS